MKNWQNVEMKVKGGNVINLPFVVQFVERLMLDNFLQRGVC